MPTMTQARTEIERRELPKADPGRKAGIPQATIDGTFKLDGVELVKLAKIAPAAKATRKAAAKKAAPKKAARKVDPHTALRQQAWNWRNEQFHAGVKVTVDEAYAKFGTHRARKA